jgi:hypothetical protein
MIALGQARELERGVDATLFAGLHFHGQDLVEELQKARLLASGLADEFGKQAPGMVHLEVFQIVMDPFQFHVRHSFG